MAEINLLKSELPGRGPLAWGRGGLVSLYVTVGFLVLEILVYGFLTFSHRQLGKQGRQTEGQVAEVDFEIGKIEAERLRAVASQRQLNNLGLLLSKHLFWSGVFEELEKVTYKLAKYTSLQVDQAEHKFILAGTIPSYTDLGKLMLGLQESPDIDQVNLRTSSLGESSEAGYMFNLEVTFNPKLLTK